MALFEGPLRDPLLRAPYAPKWLFLLHFFFLLYVPAQTCVTKKVLYEGRAACSRKINPGFTFKISLYVHSETCLRVKGLKTSMRSSRSWVVVFPPSHDTVTMLERLPPTAMIFPVGPSAYLSEASLTISITRISYVLPCSANVTLTY